MNLPDKEEIDDLKATITGLQLMIAVMILSSAWVAFMVPGNYRLVVLTPLIMPAIVHLLLTIFGVGSGLLDRFKK